VEGLLFWRNPHPSLPVLDFPISMAFRNRVFAIPVHQELTKSELEQIAEGVLKSTKEKPTGKLQKTNAQSPSSIISQ
jgi:hypothetical protein